MYADPISDLSVGWQSPKSPQRSNKRANCHVIISARVNPLRSRKVDCDYLQTRGKEEEERKYGAHLIPFNRTGERVATFRQGNAACGRDLSFYVTLIFVEFHRGRKLKRETGAGPNDWAIRRSILGGARVSLHDRIPFSLSSTSVSPCQSKSINCESSLHPGTAAT
jgi:hypothetical protein